MSTYSFASDGEKDSYRSRRRGMKKRSSVERGKIRKGGSEGEVRERKGGRY